MFDSEHAKQLFLQCGDEKIAEALIQATIQLFSDDLDLLMNSTHERTICCRLARYLEPHFPGLKVDTEYNRDGGAPKRLPHNEGDDSRVFPDIVVHKRGQNSDNNLLVIEVKIGRNAASENDMRKLRKMKEQFSYKHALFLRLVLDRTEKPSIGGEWILDHSNG
jgi:hypothetical protein